jgi:hypothetical protein
MLNGGEREVIRRYITLYYDQTNMEQKYVDYCLQPALVWSRWMLIVLHTIYVQFH